MSYDELVITFDNKNELKIEDGTIKIVGENCYCDDTDYIESKEYSVSKVISIIEEYENRQSKHKKEIENLNERIKDLTDYKSNQHNEIEKQRQRIGNFIKENKELKKENQSKENTIIFYRREFGAKE